MGAKSLVRVGVVCRTPSQLAKVIYKKTPETSKKSLTRRVPVRVPVRLSKGSKVAEHFELAGKQRRGLFGDGGSLGDFGEDRVNRADLELLGGLSEDHGSVVAVELLRGCQKAIPNLKEGSLGLSQKKVLEMPESRKGAHHPCPQTAEESSFHRGGRWQTWTRLF